VVIITGITGSLAGPSDQQILAAGSLAGTDGRC
jgi:hypothetical protein